MTDFEQALIDALSARDSEGNVIKIGQVLASIAGFLPVVEHETVEKSLDYLTVNHDTITENLTVQYVTNSSQYTQKLIEFDFSAKARTQLLPVSARIFDVYSNKSQSPTGQYGTVFNIYGRTGHGDTQILFSHEGGGIHYRYSFYFSDTFSDWIAFLTTENFSTYLDSVYASLSAFNSLSNTVSLIGSDVATIKQKVDAGITVDIDTGAQILHFTNGILTGVN